MRFQGVCAGLVSTFSGAALPLAEVLLLTRYDVNVTQVLHEIVHVSLLRALTVVPEASCDLYIIGHIWVLRVRLSGIVGGV